MACPAETKVDDNVVILFGGGVPYILRHNPCLDIPPVVVLKNFGGRDDTTSEDDAPIRYTVFEDEGIKPSVEGIFDPHRKESQMSVRKGEADIERVIAFGKTYSFI